MIRYDMDWVIVELALLSVPGRIDILTIPICFAEASQAV